MSVLRASLKFNPFISEGPNHPRQNIVKGVFCQLVFDNGRCFFYLEGWGCSGSAAVAADTASEDIDYHSPGPARR